MACEQCGQCCVNNGLIPPTLPGEEVPEWLATLVDRLRTEFAQYAEAYVCVFLTDDMRCAIHDMYKPQVCRDFSCSDQDGETTP